VIFDKFQVQEGGHGKSSSRDGLIALGGFPLPDIGQPKNPIPLNGSGLIDRQYFGDMAIVETGVDGPRQVDVGSLSVFYLTTFDNYGDYQVECSEGAYMTIEGNVAYFRAPVVPGTAWFSIDMRKFEVEVIGIGFKTPVILTPDNNYAAHFEEITIGCSEAEIVNNNGTEIWQSTDWELSTMEDFSALYRHSYQSVNKSTWDLTELPSSMTFYARCRHNGVRRTSDWSVPVKFTVTEPRGITRPQILSPIDYQFGVLFGTDVVATPYSPYGHTEEHVSTDWQIATSANFTNIVQMSMLDTVNKDRYPLNDLNYLTLYYVRVRYRSASYTTDWSAPISFITESF
jgi:hypothetical protein